MDSPFIHVERAQDHYKEWVTYTTEKRGLWETDRQSHSVLVDRVESYPEEHSGYRGRPSCP